MFSCAPSEEVDPRIDLLKQVAATGSPARSLSTASTPNLPVNFERPPELSNNRSNDGEPELSGGEPAITEVPPPGVAPPSPPPPPPPSPSQRKRRNTLSVDVSTVYESDEEINTPSDSLVSSPSEGVFSKRAFVAQGAYRVGWLLDSERSACMHCGTQFGIMRRKHHCRSCGNLYCGRCTLNRAPVTHLDGDKHRVCISCSPAGGATGGGGAAAGPRPSSPQQQTARGHQIKW